MNTYILHEKNIFRQVPPREKVDANGQRFYMWLKQEDDFEAKHPIIIRITTLPMQSVKP